MAYIFVWKKKKDDMQWANFNFLASLSRKLMLKKQFLTIGILKKKLFWNHLVLFCFQRKMYVLNAKNEKKAFHLDRHMSSGSV